MKRAGHKPFLHTTVRGRSTKPTRRPNWNEQTNSAQVANRTGPQPLLGARTLRPGDATPPERALSHHRDRRMSAHSSSKAVCRRSLAHADIWRNGLRPIGTFLRPRSRCRRAGASQPPADRGAAQCHPPTPRGPSGLRFAPEILGCLSPDPRLTPSEPASGTSPNAVLPPPGSVLGRPTRHKCPPRRRLTPSGLILKDSGHMLWDLQPHQSGGHCADYALTRWTSDAHIKPTSLERDGGHTRGRDRPNSARAASSPRGPPTRPGRPSEHAFRRLHLGPRTAVRNRAVSALPRHPRLSPPPRRPRPRPDRRHSAGVTVPRHSPKPMR